MSDRILDITVTMSPSLPVWPGNPSISLEPLAQISRGDSCNATLLSTCTHNGTHVDAPSHYVEGGNTLDKLPLDVFVGPAWVIQPRVSDDMVTAEALAQCDLPAGTQRILIKSENSKRWANEGHVRFEEWIQLSLDAAEWVVKQGIKLVGIDYLSIEGQGERQLGVHEVLLGNNVVILETVNLAHVAPGQYELSCLPLKMNGIDGSPVRAVLIDRKG